MKCPMLQRYLIQGENEALEVFDDCLKGECAWYSDSEQACSILIMASNLAGLVAIGDALLEKLPPAKGLAGLGP